ncbi:MAG: energy transducer TonB [Flavobacteriales bacterium]|nr:energy transducer TonB [Flavobacteriales bacterium]
MKIKIKEPCDADWNKMKIGVQSRHCELCVKNVMDFTQMTRQEIIMYLFNNQNQSTCGRIRGGQMDFKIADFEAIIEGNRRKKGNQPFMVLSFAALAMMSCGVGGSSFDNDPVVGAMVEIPLHIDTSSKKVELKDSSKCSSKTNPSISTPTEGIIEIETGEVIAFPDEMIDGKIEIVHPINPDLMGDVVAIETKTVSFTTTGMIAALPIELMGDTVVIHQETAFEIVEVMPEFVGGMEMLMNYLETEIEYPKRAEKQNIEGRVYVQFVVEKDGDISGAKVLKGIGTGCDEEALRVVRSMPNWIPGEDNGEKVSVKYTLPIKFVLK